MVLIFTVKLYNLIQEKVDARYNWWGSDNNPINKVYGNVNVTPWLVSNPAPTVTSTDPANNSTKHSSKQSYKNNLQPTNHGG